MKSLIPRIKTVDTNIHNKWIGVISNKECMSFISGRFKDFPNYVEFLNYRNGLYNLIGLKCRI